ncbi:hypothetical protein Ancab_021491, partial [Ancistrocladus abbreviatus]
SIAISVGDDTFLLSIFEESVGDTIFLKGFDRLQEVEKRLPVSAYGPLPNTKGSGFSRNLSPKASMANRRHLNSLESKNSSGQEAVSKGTAGSVLGHGPTAGAFGSDHVPPPIDCLGGELMVDDFESPLRREITARANYNIGFQGTDSRELSQAFQSLCALRGPTKQRPFSPLAQYKSSPMASGLPKPSSGALHLKRFAAFRPNKPVAIKNKTGTKSKSTFSNQPNKTSPASSQLRDRKELNLKKGNDKDTSGDSLHDSNIENRNHIHLSNLNHIIAEEIWEVRKRLGVQSAEDNHAIIQRIKNLQERDR